MVLERIKGLSIFDGYYRRQKLTGISSVADIELDCRQDMATYREWLRKARKEHNEHEATLFKGSLSTAIDIYRKVASRDPRQLATTLDYYRGQVAHAERKLHGVTSGTYKPDQILDGSAGMKVGTAESYQQEIAAKSAYVNALSNYLGLKRPS